jgi:hypothetical protein
MDDLLKSLCENWEKRADAHDASSMTPDLAPDMADVYMVEAATTRRLARELRRALASG